MHLCELVSENCVDLMLVVMGKVYVDLEGTGVGVLGRVYAREVLAFEK